MVNKVWLIIAALSVLITGNAQKSIRVEFENPIGIERTEIVPIPWNEIKSEFKSPENIIVKDLRTDKQTVFQPEKGEKGETVNILVQVTLKAHGKCVYEISEGKPDKFESKTFCRYVPERKDDFAWENDRIAFRMYGKALEGTNENAYGTDIWSKRVSYHVINKWYKINNYHADNGDGLDYYKVGLTLGAGDIAPYENGKLWYPGNYKRWKIIEEGPLRLKFTLEYDPWNVAGKQVTVNKTITLDAGSQMNKIEAQYTYNDNTPLNLAAGIVKRNEPGKILFDEENGITAYWEPAHGNDGTMGIACLFTDKTLMTIFEGQLLGNVKLNQPGTITYHNGAAWDKAGEITSAGAWFDYLNNFTQRLKQPVKVNIINL